MNELFTAGQAPGVGGLLGRMSGGMPAPMPQSAPQAAPQAGGNPQQMLMALAQNPTPETAKGIIAQLQSDPGAAQFVQALSQAINDPDALKKIADAGMQRLGANGQ